MYFIVLRKKKKEEDKTKKQDTQRQSMYNEAEKRSPQAAADFERRGRIARG
jgi:hypothetical protein